MSSSCLLARMLQWTRPWSQALLDLVFPPRCAGCGRSGAWLCPECQNAIRPVPPPLCERCGRPNGRSGLCVLCQHEPPSLSAIRSAALFEGPLRPAIHALKYKGRRHLAEPLGQLMAQAWPRDLFQGDCLVPVPLHPSRERERGYNQARLLAEALGRQIGLPVVAQAVRRQRATQPQVHLNAQERRTNVADAFVVGQTPLAGRRLVLIDDVCTTSATLSACARALWASGAEQVWAYTLARAAWDPQRPHLLPDAPTPC